MRGRENEGGLSLNPVEGAFTVYICKKRFIGNL